ncbi:MAG: hypothetical protein GXX82_15005 [Syntrophorhabdus sp.]|nr:hypothetical protein [Syntrophorhabdus sp.]
MEGTRDRIQIPVVGRPLAGAGVDDLDGAPAAPPESDPHDGERGDFFGDTVRPCPPDSGGMAGAPAG